MQLGIFDGQAKLCFERLRAPHPAPSGAGIMRNVILSGGIYHPFADTSQALAAIYSEQGVESLVTEDVEEAVAALADADCFTLNALRWRMLNDSKYKPFRDEWAYELPAPLAAQIAGFVESGGGLLALHTASICFDTWTDFRHLLGGVWQWGRSFHPPQGRVEVRAPSRHDMAPQSMEPPGMEPPPLAAGVEAFTVEDEIYHHLDIDSESSILLEGRVAAGAWQPIAWALERGAGRVVYDALGHDATSIQNPQHKTFLTGCVRWLLETRV
jgi:type 1 glutamine amidotransferase